MSRSRRLPRLYDLYSFKVLPWLGQQVAGDRGSYQYLVESIRRFPTQDDLAGMMAKAGLRAGLAIAISPAGIAALHSGWRDLTACCARSVPSAACS